MNHGKEELSDQVGGDLSEGEMEGARVTAVGLLLLCGGGCGGAGPYPAKQLLSHYTVPYDQLSFPDLNIHPHDEGVPRRQALSGHR